jgi:hypothetical protein
LEWVDDYLVPETFMDDEWKEEKRPAAQRIGPTSAGFFAGFLRPCSAAKCLPLLGKENKNARSLGESGFFSAE